MTAEKQLAQRKAELDAREKALNEREKTLAEKERATANSTLRSREKGKAKAKQQQAKAQSQEEQAKAEVSRRKELHEPFWKRLDEALLEQLGTPAYTPPEPGATPTTRVAFRRRRSIRHLFPRLIGKLAGLPIIGDPGELAPYPLMQAIYEGPGGQAWKDSKVQILRLGKFLGKHQHFASLKNERKRKFSVDLRFTAQPDGVESDCSLPRAVGG